MDISEKFKMLADEWSKHCQSVVLSSDINDYLNHPSYHKLIQLGTPSIPYIMERYKKDDLPWGFVLDEITGFHMIDDPGNFNPPEVKKRWIKWWEQQQKAD